MYILPFDSGDFGRVFCKGGILTSREKSAIIGSVGWTSGGQAEGGAADLPKATPDSMITTEKEQEGEEKAIRILSLTAEADVSLLH